MESPAHACAHAFSAHSPPSCTHVPAGACTRTIDMLALVQLMWVPRIRIRYDLLLALLFVCC